MEFIASNKNRICKSTNDEMLKKVVEAALQQDKIDIGLHFFLNICIMTSLSILIAGTYFPSFSTPARAAKLWEKSKEKRSRKSL